VLEKGTPVEGKAPMGAAKRKRQKKGCETRAFSHVKTNLLKGNPAKA